MPDTDIEGVGRQMTSRILISIVGKCLYYLQKWSCLDVGSVWYGVDDQFGFGHSELEVWLYIQVEISCRELEIQDGDTGDSGEIQIPKCSS